MSTISSFKEITKSILDSLIRDFSEYDQYIGDGKISSVDLRETNRLTFSLWIER